MLDLRYGSVVRVGHCAVVGRAVGMQRRRHLLRHVPSTRALVLRKCVAVSRLRCIYRPLPPAVALSHRSPRADVFVALLVSVTAEYLAATHIVVAVAAPAGILLFFGVVLLHWSSLEDVGRSPNAARACAAPRAHVSHARDLLEPCGCFMPLGPDIVNGYAHS